MAKKKSKSKSFEVRRREVNAALKEQGGAAGWIEFLITGNAAPGFDESIESQKDGLEILLENTLDATEEATVGILAKGRAATVEQMYGFDEPEYAMVADALKDGVSPKELTAWAKYAKKHLGLM